MRPNGCDELEALFVAGNSEGALHDIVRVLVEDELSDPPLLGKLFDKFGLRASSIKASTQWTLTLGNWISITILNLVCLKEN